MADDQSQTTETRSSRRIDLTERQRSVLRAVVEDYVLTAIPVGSKALVDRYGTAGLTGHRAQRHGRAGDAGPPVAIRTPAPAACRPTWATACTSSR